MNKILLYQCITSILAFTFCFASEESRVESKPTHKLRGERQHTLMNASSDGITQENQSIDKNVIDSTVDHISTIMGEVIQRQKEDRTHKNIFLRSRVIGGQDTERDRYGYMVSLTTSNDEHICGGSLIASDLVLTAAHCHGHFSKAQIGRYNTANDENYETFGIEAELIHPEFHPMYLRNDFMILRLDGHSSHPTVTLNNNVDVDMPSSLSVIGWGITDVNGPEYRGPLQESDINYVTNDQCSQSTGYIDGMYGSYYGLVQDNMMCAARKSTDSCFGDSGGPLIIKGKNVANDVQVGIVSWGFGCTNNSFPGVYSRVSNQFGWIENVVCILSSNAPSEYECQTKRQRSPNNELCTSQLSCQNGFECINGKCRETKNRKNNLP